MNAPDLIACMIALAVASFAAVTDLRQFRIPNWLTIPALGAGLVFQTVAHGGSGPLASAVGAFIGFLVLLPLYVARGMGAGDLKLSAAIGAWLGPLATLEVLAAACLLTSIWSVVLLRLRRRRNFDRADSPTCVEDVAVRPDRRSRLVPFGVALAAGLLFPLLRQ